MSSPVKSSSYLSSPGSGYAAGSSTPLPPNLLPEGSYFTPSSYITPPARLPPTASTPQRRITPFPTSSSRSRRIPLVPLSPEDYEEMLRRKELYLSLSFDEVVEKDYFTPSQPALLQRWTLQGIPGFDGGSGSDSDASDGSGFTPTLPPVPQQPGVTSGASAPDTEDGVTTTQRRGSRAWFNASQPVNGAMGEHAVEVRGKRKRSGGTAEDGSSPCEKGVARRKFKRWETY